MGWRQIIIGFDNDGNGNAVLSNGEAYVTRLDLPSDLKMIKGIMLFASENVPGNYIKIDQLPSDVVTNVHALNGAYPVQKDNFAVANHGYYYFEPRHCAQLTFRLLNSNGAPITKSSTISPFIIARILMDDDDGRVQAGGTIWGNS